MAKNNIVQASSNNSYEGSFIAGSLNNISDDATQPIVDASNQTSVTNLAFIDEDLDVLSPILDGAKHFSLIPSKQTRRLSIADERTFKSETLGLKLSGAFKMKGARLT